MKITDFRILVMGTPWRNITHLVLETDAGLTGLGEARVVGKTAAVVEHLKASKKRIVGYDPFDREALKQRILRDDFGKPGEVAFTALSLVEMACWDIIGKYCKVPVWKLLGGKLRDWVPAYANGWYTVERQAEEFATAALRVIKRGYKALKFDPFGSGDLVLSSQELRLSIELIQAVRNAVGNQVQLFLEMHGRFTPHQAREIAQLTEELQLGWLEEPCRPDNLAALQRVRPFTSRPIATGERLYGSNEFAYLFSQVSDCVDIIQPDISQCGGISEVKAITATADTHEMMVAPHNVGGGVSTMAAIHLCVGLPNFSGYLEHFNDFADEWIQEAYIGYPHVSEYGNFKLPTEPGWGVTLHESFIMNHPPPSEYGQTLDPGLELFRNADWQKRGT